MLTGRQLASETTGDILIQMLARHHSAQEVCKAAYSFLSPVAAFSSPAPSSAFTVGPGSGRVVKAQGVKYVLDLCYALPGSIFLQINQMLKISDGN